MRILVSAVLLALTVVLPTYRVETQESAKQDDSIFATWKLNLSQSNFTRRDVPAPQDHVEVDRQVGERIERTSSRKGSDGSSSLTKVTWPAEGGVAVYEQGTIPVGRTIIEARIAPGEWYAVFLSKGNTFEQLQ